MPYEQRPQFQFGRESFALPFRHENLFEKGGFLAVEIATFPSAAPVWIEFNWIHIWEYIRRMAACQLYFPTFAKSFPSRKKHSFRSEFQPVNV